jgi:hypothetical protein
VGHLGQWREVLLETLDELLAVGGRGRDEAYAGSSDFAQGQDVLAQRRLLAEQRTATGDDPQDGSFNATSRTSSTVPA